MTSSDILLAPDPPDLSFTALLRRHLQLHLLDRHRRVQSLRACTRALRGINTAGAYLPTHCQVRHVREEDLEERWTHIEDRVTAVEGHGVLHLLLPLRAVCVL